MSRLNAEHLVPDHTTPLHGAKRVHEPLTDYAAAIRTVFDQTVEGMNRLEDPVTIAQGIRLPEELGGRNAVFGKIDRALFEGDAQWALELIEMLKGPDLTPDETKRLTTAQMKGCRDLAVRESNPLNRNYYLVWARRLEKTVEFNQRPANAFNSVG